MPQEVLIALLVGALVIVVVVFILLRRRRAASQEALPLPELGEAIDYTSLPIEEPQSLGDRFRAAPPAVKLLVILAPIALIGVIAALVLTFASPGSPAPTATPPPPPVRIAVTRAEVVGEGKIVVVASTENLPSGAIVTAVLREGDQEFPWFNPDGAIAQPDPLSGQARVTLDRRAGAPTPRQGQPYTVVAIASGPGGDELARSDPVALNVVPLFAADFFATAVEPTSMPTVAATPEPPGATPEPAPTLEITATLELTGTAALGGNIRREPSREAAVLGQLAPGETVTLAERSIDGEWYRIATDAGLSGWVSRTLLTVDQELAARLPIATPDNLPTATVFNGGNVRTSPDLRGLVIDQVNAGETVQLLAKNESGTWVRIINERQINGWVSRTLLTIALEDLRTLPVSTATAPTPLPATVAALPPPPTPNATVPPATGLTANVFNGGNVRAAPNLQGQVLDQINARETVELLSKTPDGTWYRITNIRGVTGWVNRTLLTVDPDVARRVPVGQ
ncbi:MAG: SH3 domain-containing protein [Chloroflexi bacterium]|nr:SH3 domain-containing protein [Chloroflexota bacterium]